MNAAQTLKNTNSEAMHSLMVTQGILSRTRAREKAVQAADRFDAAAQGVVRGKAGFRFETVS